LAIPQSANVVATPNRVLRAVSSGTSGAADSSVAAPRLAVVYAANRDTPPATPSSTTSFAAPVLLRVKSKSFFRKWVPAYLSIHDASVTVYDSEAAFQAVSPLVFVHPTSCCVRSLPLTPRNHPSFHPSLLLHLPNCRGDPTASSPFMPLWPPRS
jgi:hypothetical protein